MGDWMASAVKPSHKGLFRKKAEAAGETTHEYAEKKKGAPGALGKEARLALTFEKERPKSKKRAPIHRTLNERLRG